jgi:hypothetical protein
MKVEVLGIVENMAFFECPSCGARHDIFGASQIEELAASYGIELIAHLPISPGFAHAMDTGTAEQLETPALAPFVDALAAKVGD